MEGKVARYLFGVPKKAGNLASVLFELPKEAVVRRVFVAGPMEVYRPQLDVRTCLQSGSFPSGEFAASENYFCPRLLLLLE